MYLVFGLLKHKNLESITNSLYYRSHHVLKLPGH